MVGKAVARVVAGKAAAARVAAMAGARTVVGNGRMAMRCRWPMRSAAPADADGATYIRVSLPVPKQAQKHAGGRL